MIPLLLDFPTQFTTKRLLVRVPMAKDGKEVNEAITDSLTELQPWMPFAQEAPNLEDTEANIREAQAKFILREDLRLSIYDLEKGHFIGSTGLHRINWHVRSFEIGYWIHTKYSGHGYITEAVEGLIDFAVKELGAKRIEIKCDPGNEKSRNIPEKLGFNLEGILRQNSKSADGKTIRDTCIFTKLFQ